MSATAAMIAKLRRMVDEPTDTTYDDTALTTIIEQHPLVDALGTDPFEVDYTTTPPTISELDDWIPTYDLNAAAHDIWTEKASAIADEFDFSADGGNYKRNQKFESYLKSARYYGGKRSIRSIPARVNPRREDNVEDNSD